MISKLREGTNQTGKEQFSLEELYTNLKKYCYFLSKNKWDGEDLAQQSVLKALEHYQSEITQPLLKKIAYHQWIDTTRKKKNVLLDEIPDKANESGFESIFTIRDYLMKGLTPKQLVIYVLKEGFEYQSKEIADLLDISETAVKSILFRARKQLEKRKDEDEKEPSDLYWEEVDEELLSTVIYEALYLNDPSTLITQIRLIPALFNVGHSPKLVSQKPFTRKAHSPTNSFYSIAA
ncbi:sigma factor-like helix-turn-helix DNA-binding protein [Cytobacillus luteolus]|nr:sigma factor-like helix-turn-helix DNA-binding protein [Cytobacillus luteolus]MBP1942495.1 RNA polymerase sigma-70 factor (ECF subfamily) [Cytobacillus luteolus]